MTATNINVDLVGRHYRLRPIVADDYYSLYIWATTPPTSTTWRFRGVTPSPESFSSELWAGTLAQFVVSERGGDDTPVGLVQAFNHDAGNGLVYLSLLIAPERQTTSSVAAEALPLFIRYLFGTFPLRKVYFETTEGSFAGVTQVLARWDAVREEGRLRAHQFDGDSYEDLLVIGVSREDFMASMDVVERLIERRSDDVRTLHGTGAAGASVRSFGEFVDSIPLDIVPGLGEHETVTGGLSLAHDLRMDSLALTELFCWMEDTFDVTLSSATQDARSLQDVYASYEAAATSGQLVVDG